ncbi:hypothetical protein [Carboxylicivirga caseinilyticus]|uniref:hypothetical protein n=1 Tax=Carboxylicivirga caseinilyticus TaxID=3417572 RepID=UPI003D3374C7|nr:hypothetical protein [Marinilabiliaceae bacterium A049]
MKTKRTFIIYILLLISSTYTYSQYEQFFRVDDNSLLAIDLQTNANYDGTCQQYFNNDQIAWQMTLKDGKPVEMKNWCKNGQLSDSTIYINGFNLFKRFTFDRKGRIVAEEILEMKSIAQSNDKQVLKMAGKKKYAYSTVYEDCLSYKSITYTRDDTPQFVYETRYDKAQTLLVQYHKNGNVSDSTFFTNKSVSESKYIPVKNGNSVEYDLAGNKSSERRFENDKLVKETLFENENTTLELNYNKGKLTKDAMLISENGENQKVFVKLDWQGNPKVYN